MKSRFIIMSYTHVSQNARVTIHALGMFLFLLFITQQSIAQTYKIEELQKKIESSRTSSEQADLHYQLAEILFSYSFEEGLKHATQALRIAEDANYKKGKAQAFTALGNYFYYKGERKHALENYQWALALVSNSDMGDFPLRLYLRLSIFYRQQGSFDSAQLYLSKVERSLPSDEKSLLMAAFYASSGILANARSRNDMATYLLKKSIDIRSMLGDTVRLGDSWRNLGVIYTDLSMYDSADYCFEQARKLFNKTSNPEVLMLLHLSQGEANFQTGNFKQAIENYNAALDLLKKNNYRRYYAYLLYKIGELYENEGSYHTAYEYLFKSLKEFEAINAQQDRARVYSQIGWCYNYEGNYALAIENGNNALRIAHQIGDSSGIAQNKNLIGYAMLHTGKYNGALTNFQEALAIRRDLKNLWGSAYTLYNLALVKMELKDYQAGFDLLFEALELNKRIGNKGGIVFTCNELGLQFTRQRNFVKAEYYLREAQSLAREIPLPTQLVVNYKNSILLFEAKNDNRKTVQYFKLYSSLKDSLADEINSGRMATADALFQLQKKANEVLLVSKENELHQEKIKNQEAEIAFQKKIILLVIVGITILIVLVAVIYRLLRLRTRAKELLRRQFLEISEQKEEIQAQSEELKEGNDRLVHLNNELIEKNTEIEVQSEKINEANVTLEKRVAERTAQLKTAYNELETFFYKASHDFRRPLTSYLGLVEIAKISVKDPHALELFDKVKDTTIGLDKMLNKLQSISSIDYERATKEFSLSDLITNCLDKFKYAIQAKKIQVVVDNNASRVFANEYLCGIFLENLIENGIDFCTPISPILRIVTSQANENFAIIIEDNGQGIAAAIQHRIFEMYFRGNDNSRGNGLGLYIAKRAIDKLGGTISFISRLNEGTSFKVTIPSKKGHLSFEPPVG